MDNAFARLNAPHFLRWIALSISMFFAGCLIIPGILWTKTILNKTGYRTIDLLIVFFVPGGSTVVSFRTTWRYCATEKYWEHTIAAPAFEKVAA